MTSLISILAGGIPDVILNNLPMILAIICVVVLLIAFFVGFYKGFRRVSWSGLVWLVAATAYFVVGYLTDNNSAFAQSLIQMGFGEGIGTFLPYLISALICIAATLLIYGLCSMALRPRTRLVEKSGDRFVIDENGVEYDTDEMDYDDYEAYRNTTMVQRKGYGKPSPISRIFGALSCMITVATWLFVVIAVAWFVVKSFGWDETALSVAFSAPIMRIASEYLYKYAMDFLLIGVILKVASWGYKRGFVASIHSLFMKLGVIVAIVVSFWLPFSSFAVAATPEGTNFFVNFVNGCINAVAALGVSELLSAIIGRILCGLLICVVALLAVWLVHFILKSISDGIDGVGVFRAIDGVLACAVYTVLALIGCYIVFCVFYLLGANGIFDMNVLVSDGSMSKSLLAFCQESVEPSIEAIKALISGASGS